MIECPDCGKTIHGTRCKCGYKATVSSGTPYVHRDKAKDEAEHLESCRQWLINEGIVTPGMTTAERMKALAAYRKRIAATCKPDPLEWARRIIRRFEDGENISRFQERMAKEALGI